MVGVVVRLGKMVENGIPSVYMCDIMSHILQESHNRARHNHFTSRSKDLIRVT